jgi:penicillin-binding protein 1A
VDALIATEDHRFYEHHGIDFRRTAGALISTL